MQLVSSFPAHPEFSRQVYLVDCIWELFVVIGDEARSRRLEIRLALAVADVRQFASSSIRLDDDLLFVTGTRKEGLTDETVHSNNPYIGFPDTNTRGPSPHIPRIA